MLKNRHAKGMGVRTYACKHTHTGPGQGHQGMQGNLANQHSKNPGGGGQRKQRAGYVPGQAASRSLLWLPWTAQRKGNGATRR
jgi:hypothetical protein